MGLINPSDNILGGVDTASHFLLFSPQGKKGRPGEDGTPGAKGQKVSILFLLLLSICHSPCRVLASVDAHGKCDEEADS